MNVLKFAPAPETNSLYRRVVIAATLLVTVSVAIYFYRIAATHSNGSTLLDAAQDFPAGRNTATLTLANGKVISLSDAKNGVFINGSQFTYNDGSGLGEDLKNEPLGTGEKEQVIKGAFGYPFNFAENSLVSGKKRLTVATPRGGQYQILLPDGTKVWLNAASSLKFPQTFSGLKERKVELNGEAYFVVKHDEKQPFLVETKGQLVEDIGTEFNINAYADESCTKTTLVEGAAHVKMVLPTLNILYPERDPSPQIINGVTLKPGQQSALLRNTLKVETVDTEAVVSWRAGYFKFHGEDIKSIMRKIERWYNVDVEYDGEMPQKGLEGTMSRYQSISKVLDLLQATGLVKFEYKDNKILVKK